MTTLHASAYDNVQAKKEAAAAAAALADAQADNTYDDPADALKLREAPTRAPGGI